MHRVCYSSFSLSSVAFFFYYIIFLFKKNRTINSIYYLKLAFYFTLLLFVLYRLLPRYLSVLLPLPAFRCFGCLQKIRLYTFLLIFLLYIYYFYISFFFFFFFNFFFFFSNFFFFFSNFQFLWIICIT